jgi:acetyl esterase/lipase
MIFPTMNPSSLFRLCRRALAAALLSLAAVASAQTAAAPRTMFENMTPEVRTAHEAAGFRLWAGRAPEARGDTAADIPMLYPVLPPKGTAPAGVVLVLPGGGYNYLSAWEAFPIAEHFRAAGLAAFVLQYRLRPYDRVVSLLDVQRAVRLLRARAAEFGLDPQKICAIGFSAGGHLAANLSTHADDGRPDDTDPVERQSCRLQSALLIYPSIVYANLPRGKDRRTLPEVLELEGLHRAVDSRTPPTFLVVGGNDDRTPYENCLAYAAKLHEAGVRFELHVLGTGSHGFSLRVRDRRLQIWGQLALDWLTTGGFLPPPKWEGPQN